jgi:hypothetical protein
MAIDDHGLNPLLTCVGRKPSRTVYAHAESRERGGAVLLVAVRVIMVYVVKKERHGIDRESEERDRYESSHGAGVVAATLLVEWLQETLSAGFLCE